MWLRNRAGKLIGRDPFVAALCACLLGTCIFLATRIWAYLAVDAPPFGYYYDLGVNLITAQYIARAIHSWGDLVDNLGWGSWGDFPNFLFNPSSTYFILVPLEMALKDAWLSVKSMQVFEEIVAFAGAAYLFTTVARRDIWCLVAGILYAILPATALQIRGNLDIGLVYALLPLALGIELQLVRRFGSAALPLCGIVASLAGFCFAPEYLVFSSLPAYVVAVSAARPRFAVRGTLLALLGFVCMIGAGSYFILPTIEGGHLFTDPAARTASLAAGSELGIFSESWSALDVLIPQEFLISSLPQFNAGQDLGFLWLSTSVLWCLALFALWRGWFGPNGRLQRTVAVISLVLLVFAMGWTLPLGSVLWNLLHELPVLASVRTPDRFLILPLLTIVLGATESLASLAKGRSALGGISVALVVLSISQFLNLDFKQHWLTTESDLAYREPDLNLVNAAVMRVGGRTVSYAYARDGSQFFTTDYGVPNATLWFHWDPSAHYYFDGLGGFGLFARSDVQTIVASPNWTVDSPLLPSTAWADASFPGRPLLPSSGGLFVKQIASRPVLTAGKASCLAGGPGLLDWATGVAELQGLTFVSKNAPCEGRTYLDYDPRDELRSGASVLGVWHAGELLPEAPALRDADYPFIVGRTFINDGWYRNSVDGDDAGAETGARHLLSAVEIPIKFPAADLGRNSTLFVRLASRSSTTLSVRSANGPPDSIAITPTRGMHWYEIPLRNSGRSGNVTLSFGPFVPEEEAAATDWSGIALDKVALMREPVPSYEPTLPADAVLFSMRRLARVTKPPNHADQTDSLVLVGSSNVAQETQAGKRTYVAEQGHGILDYRWGGTTGDYIITGVGTLAGPRAEIALTAGTCSTNTSHSVDDVTRIVLRLRVHLVPHRSVSVALTSAADIPGAMASLTSISVVRVSEALSGRPNDDGGERFDADLSDGQEPPNTAQSAELLNGAVGATRSPIAYHFETSGEGTAAILHLDTAGEGSAVVRLVCGSDVSTKSIASGETELSLAGTRLHACRVEIKPVTRGFAVNSLRFDLLHERFPHLEARIWLPRGSYTVRIFRPGIEDRRAFVSLDGAAASSEITMRRSGYHNISMRDISSDDRVLAFVSHPRLTYFAPQAVQSSTYRWSVAMKERATLEVAWYPDGNWRLENDAVPGAVLRSVRCDLLNSCFVNLPPGHYHLYHQWPAPLRFGFMLSALALACAGGALMSPLVVSQHIAWRQSRPVEIVSQ